MKRDSPRPIRIGYVTASLDPGGAERQMLILAETLPKDQFVVEFICLSAPGRYADRARAAGARVHALSFRGRRSWQGSWLTFAGLLVWNVIRYVRLTAWRYDVIDAWLFNAYVLAAVTRPLTWPRALLAGRRSLSGYKSAFNGFQRAGEALANRVADRIVANSAAVKADVVRRESVDPARISVIHNATLPSLPMSPEERTRLRTRWGASDATLVIGCVANYKPGKGLPTLVAVMADLVSRRPQPDLRLVLVGEGPLRSELETIRDDLGLGSTVVLHGPEAEARAIYPAFDVFAFASEAEGLPNVLLEAAAAALPIVTTAAGGAIEIVEDGVSGRVVPVGDARALADALEDVCGSSDLRRELGAQALNAVGRYGGTRMSDEFAALYRAVAEGSRRPWARH